MDVFECLYKSATKQNFVHKTLKSSRTKIVKEVEKKNLTRKELMDENENFAKLLKAQ